MKMKTDNPLKICLIGAWRNYNDNAKQKAIDVGRWVAENGHTLITGACLGIPSCGAEGCKVAGGRTLGYSPANHKNHHLLKNGLTHDYMDEIVYMKSEKALSYSERNIVNISNADIVILISGRMGAINEYTIAQDLEKPIGIIEGTGEAADVVRVIELGLYGKMKSTFGRNVSEVLNKLVKDIA
jgi:uncharacterized protein (TIGR00725 family)